MSNLLLNPVPMKYPPLPGDIMGEPEHNQSPTQSSRAKEGKNGNM